MMGAERFAEALSPEMGTTLENRPIVCGFHNVVIPTVGMIVPNWLLIVPRTRTLNYAQQEVDVRQEVEALVDGLSANFANSDLETVILEHGPSVADSAVGCGIDHAHLHILFLQRGFADTLWRAIEADLDATTATVPMKALHSDVDSTSAYYLAWRGGQRLLEQPARVEISQRFRKLIATTAGVADQWDYRTNRFDDNIQQTVAMSQRRHVLAA